MLWLFISLLTLPILTAQTQAPQNLRLRAQVPYAGQTLANICGYWQGGREYALCGGSKGTIIMDVTNPDAPALIKQVPIVDNLWKEIKTYRNYAYVTTEGGGGLQIINLARLPDTVLPSRQYTGDSTITGLLGRIHSLHIDTARGFCYLFGATGIANGGAIVLDIRTDPWNPRYVGQYNTNYIHDGYAINDTLYGSHIYAGYFSVIDFRNKSNPIVLATQTTPTAFTHNTWRTDDRKTILTTDENASSFLAAYDVTTPTAIRLLDKVQGTSSGSIVHNTHIRGNYAITSWYKDGILIHDVTRPQNLIQVANFDTYATGGDGFNGTWGVYPFLPSGTIVISNIEDGLFVVTPNYVRACYLEGNVVDSLTNAPLQNVLVKINGSTDRDKQAKSDLAGDYRTGQVTAGAFTATYSKAGYISKTVSITLVNGQVLVQNVALARLSAFALGGSVSDNATGARLANAKIRIQNADFSYDALTDISGNFLLNSVYQGDYSIFVGSWGYLHRSTATVSLRAATTNLTYRLDKGYQDDFWTDFGWTIGGDIPVAANRGRWERGTPIGTLNGADYANSNVDAADDLGTDCYITGNGGGAAGTDDVDNGTTILNAPTMKLRGFTDPLLSFQYWFYNAGGNTQPNDTFKIYASNGLRDTLIQTTTSSASAWRRTSYVRLRNFLPLTDSFRIYFVASDDVARGHIVEAGVDNFLVTDGFRTNVVSPSVSAAETWQLQVQPNPCGENCWLMYQNSGSTTDVANATLSVFDAVGKQILTESIVQREGNVWLDKTKLPHSGIYFVHISSPTGQSKWVKMVRL